jgi:serine/threonine protein kinase/tetratricopeptide (TPR) repeat protein
MQPDTPIGPYRVVRSLGQGGMGEVALAYDARLKRHVALKSILRDGAGGQSQLVREARAIAALVHPGIAGIHDIIEHDDRSYIVMEYVEGETLWDRLTRGVVPASDAADYCAQLCDALEAAHSRGIIHRDLKPSNIMVGTDNRVKILDFGLARQLPSSSQPTDITTASIASLAAGGVAGTVGYMAPEQVLGQPADQRSDIFSLGVVLFEMLARRRPFPERDILAYAVAVTTQEAPPASSVNGSISAEVSAVISRALQRDPEARYQSAHELAADMNAAIQGKPVLPPTQTTHSVARFELRYSRARLSIAAAVLALAVGGALALVAFPRARLLTSSPGQPSVLAVMPAVAQDIDPSLQGIAVGITTLLTANLAAVPTLNAVQATPTPGIGTMADMSQAMQRIGASWALRTTLRISNGVVASDLSLHEAGTTTPAWREHIEGDALTVANRTLLAVARGLVDVGLTDRLEEPVRHQLTSIGTGNSSAFMEYSQGRRFLAGVITVDILNQAVTHFEAAVERDGQFALAWAGLADALRRRYQQARLPDDINRAIDAAHRAAAIDPNLATVQLTLANVFNLSGRSGDAVAAVDRAIALHPSSDDAHRLRGTLLAQAGRPEEGVAALKQAATLRPAFYLNYEALGFALYRLGRMQEAADNFRRVTELAPEFAGGYQFLGTALHRLGHVDEAVGHYEHAVRLGPSATAYSNLAYSYYETGRYDDALNAYQESIKRDARRPAAHRNIGDVYARLGRSAEARQSYEAAIEVANALLKVNASDAATIALVALCEAKLGRRLAAERHAAEALSLTPKDMEVTVRNAEVYAILRQPSRAIGHLRTAIGLGYERHTLNSNDELRTLANEPAFKELISGQH